MAKVQIYLLDNFVAQSWFTTIDGTMYSVRTHTQSSGISRDTLLFDFLPLSWPKQHRHMIHGPRGSEQHSKGAEQQGRSSRAEPCHGSRRAHAELASCTGKARGRAQLHFPLGLLPAGSSRAAGDAALQQQGGFSTWTSFSWTWELLVFLILSGLWFKQLVKLPAVKALTVPSNLQVQGRVVKSKLLSYAGW